jgi:hypothetical protein
MDIKWLSFLPLVMLLGGLLFYALRTRYKSLLALLLTPFSLMVIECSWCGKLKGFKKDGKGVTSGICEGCYIKAMQEISQTK